MKEKLRKVFLDLSNKQLSEEEALERIKAIKKAQNGAYTKSLFAFPKWQLSAFKHIQEKPAYTNHTVVFLHKSKVDFEKIKQYIPQSHCLQIQPKNNSIDLDFSEIAVACFKQVQELLNTKPKGKTLLQIVINEVENKEIYIALSALLKTANIENPNIFGQIILVDKNSIIEKIASQLINERNISTDTITIIKYQEGNRYSLNLEEIEVSDRKPQIIFKEQGVYLITGGLGGLGIQFAKEIATQLKKYTIILTGRSALTPEKQVLLNQLSAKGGKVEYVQLDVTNQQEVENCIAKIVKNYKYLNGILHSAGINTDNFIIKKSTEEFKKVIAPKVSGTHYIDIASKEIDLDFLILFSSIASQLGNTGQADYAAANSFMDQYAAYRNQLAANGQRYGKTLSINWPLWKEGGMLIEEEIKEQLFKETGLQPLESATGIELFYQCMNLSHATILAVQGDTSKIKSAFFQDYMKSDSKEISIAKNGSTVTSSEKDINNLLAKTKDFIRDEFSEVLKLPARKIETKAQLEKYGIDSILAMNLTSKLEKTFGRLSKTLFFEYQTIDELSDYLVTSHQNTLLKLFNKETDTLVSSVNKPEELPVFNGETLRQETRTKRKVRKSKNDNPELSFTSETIASNDPIAIIGLSGRYPESYNIKEFWENLRDGKDCIIEVPEDRWDWRTYYSEDRTEPNKHYSKWGGFIEGVDEFDPRFFNISPREARNIDPQERLFLQHAWMAVEDAGYTRESLQVPTEKDLSGQVGVYVGVMYGEYNLSGSLASIANRVSYVLNLHGPSITLDTMCSSSLTSIHLACQDLKTGRTSLALAGGVNVSVDPGKYQMLSTGQFISSDGHCQSFGEGGDGYIPGEGVGVVMLKRLSEAEKDGDHIYGIIKGSALNHGGKTNGYSVPNPKAQASVISRALRESNTNPRHVSYVEAHGTGTKLGDPIEITSLNKAFHQTQENHFCLLGSAKSNIGHCESAAGIAGLTKILLQLKHKQVVPSLHSKRLNPHIDFDNTPFVVNQTLRNWDNPILNGEILPRIAGISSFGAGGANAHIIVQEYATPVAASTKAFSGEVAVVLSARTAEQLQTKAAELLTFLEEAESVPLSSLAYTLQVGREAMEVRLALLVSSVSTLSEALTAFVNQAQISVPYYQASVKPHKDAVLDFSTSADAVETIDGWLTTKNYDALLSWWVKGLEVDWAALYGTTKPQRMSLPTYPFARERYWLDASLRGRVGTVATETTTAVLHPLVHQNTSDLRQIRYSSTFSGDEKAITQYTFGKNGHSVHGLPSVAGLEMVHASLQQALPQEENNSLELHNIAFGSFMKATQSPISIALFAKGETSAAYEIYNEEADTVYTQGEALYIKDAPTTQQNIEQLRTRMSQGTLTGTDLYKQLTAGELQYGSYYQSVQTLYKGEGELLAHLVLPTETTDEAKTYHLHPALLEGAIQAAGLLTGAVVPSSINKVRIHRSLPSEVYAWVRYDHTSESETISLSIDLCDAKGNLCLELTGVQYQGELATTETVAAPETTKVSEPITTTQPTEREVLFSVASSQEISLSNLSAIPVNGLLKKPSAIQLASPASLPNAISESQSLDKGQITLSGYQDTPSVEAEPSVRLYDQGRGIYKLQIGIQDSSNTLNASLIQKITSGLAAASQETTLKVLLLEGTTNAFLHGDREAFNRAVSQKFYESIITFPYPVIAVMEGNASGSGFLAGALCDFMIGSETSNYGLGMYANKEVISLLNERFGSGLANELLRGTSTYTGSELKKTGFTFPIVAGEELKEYALELAENLSEKSATSLRLLKQHLARHLATLATALTELPETVATTSAVSIDLESLPQASGYSLTTEEGIIEVTIETGISELTALFSHINLLETFGPIILKSKHEGFLPEATTAVEILALTQQLLAFKYLVVAVLDNNANGKGWLLSQYCDAVAYTKTSTYSTASLLEETQLLPQAGLLFTHRYGEYMSKELLLLRKSYTGTQLKEKIGTLTLVEKDAALEKAKEIAVALANFPTDWKATQAKYIKEKVNTLPEWLVIEESEVASKLGPVALASEVVKATLLEGGILEVRLEDREARNMFTDAFIAGVTEVFDHIKTSEAYKVVILTGYDNYFASGGTKEGLLAIQEGKSKFTDTKIYQMAMECKLPVIAAMQGHGIGAGWCLGMFADFILFSKERRYLSPYMNYGFTPGAGATFIFPKTMGYDLARETMLTANEYAGIEFKNRGVNLPVLDKDQVFTKAMELAEQIATLPKSVLLALKHQFTQQALIDAAETYKLELEMHEKTFVKDEETLKQIEKNFTHETSSTATENNIVEEIAEVETETDEEASTEEDFMQDVIANMSAFLAEELQMEPHEIDEDAQFVDLGLDSITGVTWIRKINNEYKTSLEATQIYNYPTINQLGDFLKEEMQKLGLLEKKTRPAKKAKPALPKPEAKLVLKPAPKTLLKATSKQWFKERKLTSFRNKLSGKTIQEKTNHYKAQPIAIIGIAGQFPEAANTEEFWKNIAKGKNCIKEVPKERWDINKYYQEGASVPGKTNSKWLGSLKGYDEFDPLFFTIPPIEAESMDPQQRLFLQSCWHGIEDAGYDPQSLSGSKCGVFVGCTTGDYQLLSREQQLSAQGFTGGTSSILAARISYFLNLQGPCIALDTACSSSLVAISNACDSLLNGSSNIALAGGVYVMTGPEMHVKTAQSGMLSVDGKCYTFDQRANGFVPGEAVGVAVLKRLEDAERDNDTIYGVIQGWGINQDGRTNGITAPNSLSQTSLEQDIYDRYEINPENIQLIEAHGTGTKLGDPIEVQALKKSFKKYTDKNQYCALGSVKSNIGHCLTAAGIAGFIKVLMAMKNRKLPPTINYNQLNEHISLDDSPFFVNDTLKDWNVAKGEIRQAAISGFGFSGTNAHLVVAEYVPTNTVKQPVTVITQQQKYFVPLSARNEVQLQDITKNLLTYIETNAANIDLISLSYTLQAGRAPMEERLGFMVKSIEDLVLKLKEFIDGNRAIKDVFRGKVKQNKEGLKLISQDKEMKEIIIKKWISDKKLTKLFDLWAKGLDFNWAVLYGEQKPDRLRLPLYPFAKESYWIESTEEYTAPTAAIQPTVRMHPLLHKNTASLKEQGYTESLSGTDSLLDGKQDDEGKKVAKIQRISLPTYPFAKDRCWPDLKPVFKQEVDEADDLLAQNLDSIEDVINKIDSELLDTDEAVVLLKDLI